jgi:hypothetical protein
MPTHQRHKVRGCCGALVAMIRTSTRPFFEGTPYSVGTRCFLGGLNQYRNMGKSPSSHSYLQSILLFPMVWKCCGSRNIHRDRFLLMPFHWQHNKHGLFQQFSIWRRQHIDLTFRNLFSKLNLCTFYVSYGQRHRIIFAIDLTVRCESDNHLSVDNMPRKFKSCDHALSQVSYWPLLVDVAHCFCS